MSERPTAHFVKVKFDYENVRAPILKRFDQNDKIIKLLAALWEGWQMRIAVCDDDPADQEQFDNALHGWDPTRNAEKFLRGAALLEAARQQLNTTWRDNFPPL